MPTCAQIDAKTNQVSIMYATSSYCVQAQANFKYQIQEKTQFQKLLQFPPNVAMLNTILFYPDISGKVFHRVLFDGVEYDLLLFNIMLYLQMYGHLLTWTLFPLWSSVGQHVCFHPLYVCGGKASCAGTKLLWWKKLISKDTCRRAIFTVNKCFTYWKELNIKSSSQLKSGSITCFQF